MPVQDLSDLRALEAFVLHDVTPVTRRVPHRQEDRLRLLARTGERFIIPSVPIDGVVFVLEQVGAVFGRETIHISDYVPPSAVRL